VDCDALYDLHEHRVALLIRKLRIEDQLVGGEASARAEREHERDALQTQISDMRHTEEDMDSAFADIHRRRTCGRSMDKESFAAWLAVVREQRLEDILMARSRPPFPAHTASHMAQNKYLGSDAVHDAQS